MAKKGEKILTRNRVEKLGLDKVSVITADMIKGYTSIGEYAFFRCTGLTSVTIPNSVTSIGLYAFSCCSGLTSVIIPNSVTSIGYYAFEDCGSLTSIIVENGNTVYDSRNNCNAIIETATNTLIVGCKNTIIPNSVTSIGEYAFLSCSGLTYVAIPDGVKSIESGAFGYCSSLTYVTIPNSVTSIERSAFYGCSGLTSVIIPNSVTSIGDYAFEGCSSLTSVTIPNSVTSIGDCAFSDFRSLISVRIGDKIYKNRVIKDGKCIAYKAFNSDMTCRSFQYKEGETYEFDGEPKLCEQGFHACLSLADVFNYYHGKIGQDIVVHEVELEGVSYERNNDSKVVAKKITIGKRIL